MDETTLSEESPTPDGDTDPPLDYGVIGEEKEVPISEEEDEADQTVQHNPSQGTSNQANWSHEPEVLPDEEDDIQHPL